MPNDQPTRRLHFSLRQLFLAVALIAIGLSVWNWVFRKEVLVRAATPEDEAVGVERNVAVLTGSFMKETLLTAKLYLVQSGIITNELTEIMARLNRNAEGGPFRETANFRLAFGEQLVRSGGRSIQFLFVGENPSGGSMRLLSEPYKWKPPHLRTVLNFNVVATKTLPGRITPGRPHIVYVEGDGPINLDRAMTVEEFAKANPGNYLVVTVEVR
jgi:hypothetical protein